MQLPSVLSLLVEHYLVCPAYQVHVMFVQKLGHHVCPEGEGDAAVVFAPAQHIFVWISPQQVTQ